MKVDGVWEDGECATLACLQVCRGHAEDNCEGERDKIIFCHFISVDLGKTFGLAVGAKLLMLTRCYK